MELGRVREAQGDRVIFIVTADTTISFGQIVKITPSREEGASRVFYARVTDAGSRSTLGELDELRDLKGSMRTVGPYSQFRFVEAVLFLERDSLGRIRSPTLNPDYGWAAESLGWEDYKALELTGELKLGYLREGSAVGRRTVGIGVECIPRMMAVVGQIGSGKTNAELVLNAALMETEGKAVGLIFDFAGELLTGKGIGKGLADSPLASERLEYYGLERPRVPVAHGLIRIGLRRIEPQDLWKLYPDLSPPQAHYAKKLSSRLGRGKWITEAVALYEKEDVYGVLKVADGQKAVATALLRKLSYLNGTVFADLDHDFSHSVVKALAGGKSVLVDVSGMREEAQRQVVGWVADRAVEYYKARWRSDYEAWRRLPYLLITLEEAHKFLEERHTLFSDIALTCRKYKVGLNAVTPRPCRINRDVFAELWTKLILKTSLKEDRVYLAENTPYLEYSDVELKMLDVGEALLVSQPEIHFAVPVKIFDYKEYLEQSLSKQAYAQREALAARNAPVKKSEVEENVL